MKQSPSKTWSRRDFLGASVVGALGVPWISGAQSAPVPGFTHRALNGWITDLATEPDPNVSWLDEDAMKPSLQMKR